MKWFSRFLGMTGLLAGLAAPAVDAGVEEFDGPFPSWRNLKIAYGAVGDGRVDDTAAWQRALDDLVKHREFCVLYVPAGHYRLTDTVKTLRLNHTDCQGVAIVGASPATTVLQWDGSAGKTVFQFDGWYSKISRLAIDGAGRAGVDLGYGPSFSTYNQTSDMEFRNAAIGVRFGDGQGQGQAENEILRCRFSRCADCGIKTDNFNSMDIWVWYSRFVDCGYGLFNGAGNFHAWQNIFERSTISDIGIGNLMVFSFVNNTSIGSRRFLDFTWGHSWGSPMTISGNRILDPTGDLPLRLVNGGPYLVMDNLFKLPPDSTNRAAQMTWGDQTFVGNTYTATNAVVENGRFRRVGEKVVSPRPPALALPSPPVTPESEHRRIIEVHHHYMESAGGAIQDALDEADHFRGERPVVHIPAGEYRIFRTLKIPAESDVQLVGDSAGETGTRLIWSGAPGGLLLKLCGPTRATLRDLYLQATDSRVLLVDQADQPDGKIFTDEFNVRAPGVTRHKPTAAIFLNHIGQTDVLFRCLQGGGNGGVWVEAAGPAAGNQISIFTGATGSADGEYDVHDGATLVVRSVYHEKSSDSLHGLYLYDSGTLAIDASRFSNFTSSREPLVALTNFHGLFTVASSDFVPVDSTNVCRFELSGTKGVPQALALNNLFWETEPGVTSATVWVNRENGPVRGGLIGCNMNTSLVKGGFSFLDNVWQEGEVKGDRLPDSALLEHLAPLRQARVWLPGPVRAHATDLAIYRVFAVGGPGAVVEFRAGE